MKNTLLLLGTLFLILIKTVVVNAHHVDEPLHSYFVIEGEYKKVDSSELTPAVIEQILKEYPTSKLAAVYKNDKEQFKLIMVLQSGTRRTVYIDSSGRWFKPKR